MMIAGRILFGLLVILSALTIAALGRPRHYPDRGVAWYLVATAWSALLIDGLFLMGTLGLADGQWAPWTLMAFLGVRAGVSVWLLSMILRARGRS